MNNKKLSISILIGAFFLTTGLSAQTLTVKEIMKEPSIAGARISGERLSPDGRYVAYLWNSEGKEPEDLYLLTTSDGVAKKVLSPVDLISKKAEKEKDDPLEYGVVINDEFVRSRRNQIGNVRWSPDSSRILFTQNGDIFVLKIGEAKPKRITKTETSEFSAEFLDNDRILFQQSGNLFSINTKDGTLIQISREADSQKQISVFGAEASRNGEMIAYISSDNSKQLPLFVPNYLPYYTAAPTIRRGWTKTSVYAAKTDGSAEKGVEIELPKPEGESFISGLEWLSDHRTLIVDRIDKTHKRRQIFAVTMGAENQPGVYLVHQEEDEKWVGRISRLIEGNPENSFQFFFASEKDSGFNHLYLANLDQAKFADGKANAVVKQLTKGNWEISWADWERRGEYIVFLSTAGNPAGRQFASVKVNDLETAGVPFSPRRLPRADVYPGMKTSPQIENSVLIFGASEWNRPEELTMLNGLHVSGVNHSTDGFSSPLTATAPREFLNRNWNEPRFTSFPSADGKEVPAKIYVPSGFDKTKRYPMVIFVHGAGYLQNVINGWNNYYREFMFNQLLTQKGYVVLDIDYRGSAGYGRDWRTDVYDFLGGKDYTDHLDGIDFMVRNYSVDQKRIGVYGGSYGGFMAAMLVMRAPEKIAAAAALRPVMDWKNYYATNPFYTSQRLRSPKENPEGYRRSSPISYAEKLQKPLLILHGLVDSNVHAQDSIQLVERLIRLDKTEYFDLMLYPSENHAFQRSTSWEDEYERILAFFEKHLK